MGAARLEGMVYGDGLKRKTGKQGSGAKKKRGFFFWVVLVRKRGGSFGAGH